MSGSWHKAGAPHEDLTTPKLSPSISHSVRLVLREAREAIGANNQRCAILSRTSFALDLDSVSLTGTDSVSCASYMSWDAACPLRHFASADPESP